jgi:hypothetical protein
LWCGAGLGNWGEEQIEKRIKNRRESKEKDSISTSLGAVS